MDTEEDFSRRKTCKISRRKVCVSCGSPNELMKCKKGHVVCSGCVAKSKHIIEAESTGLWPCPSADCQEFIPIGGSHASTSADSSAAASLPPEGETIKSLQADVAYSSAEPRGRVRIAHTKSKAAKTDIRPLQGRDPVIPLLQGRDPDDWFSSPAGWTSVTEKRKFCSVNLEQKSVETQRVIAALGAVLAKRVYRIENEWLWQLYCLKKKHMMSIKNSGDINERILYQGCTFEELREIGEFGWMPQNITSTRNGTGYHFHTRCCRRAGQFPEVLLVAQVLCGTSTLGAPTYGVPPHRDIGGRYGSCVDSKASPKTFVLFDPSQCYPRYAVILNDPV